MLNTESCCPVYFKRRVMKINALQYALIAKFYEKICLIAYSFEQYEFSTLLILDLFNNQTYQAFYLINFLFIMVIF